MGWRWRCGPKAICSSVNLLVFIGPVLLPGGIPGAEAAGRREATLRPEAPSQRMGQHMAARARRTSCTGKSLRIESI